MGDKSLAELVDTQASLNVQLSEDIRRYEDEVQRLSAEGRIDFGHELHANSSAVPTKAGLEKTRETLLQHITSGVARSSFEPTVVHDVLSHSVLLSGAKRNVTSYVLGIVERFLKHANEGMLREKVLLHENWSKQCRGTAFAERHASNFIDTHAAITAKYRKFSRRLRDLEKNDGLPPSVDDLEEYLKWVLPRQTLAVMSGMYSHRLRALDLAERANIFKAVAEFETDHSDGERSYAYKIDEGDGADGEDAVPMLTVDTETITECYNACISSLDIDAEQLEDDTLGDGVLLYSIKSLFSDFFEGQNDYWGFLDRGADDDPEDEDWGGSGVRTKVFSSNWTKAAHGTLAHAMLYNAAGGSGPRVAEDGEPDVTLQVEQAFLKENNIAVVSKRVAEEVASHAQRMGVRTISTSSLGQTRLRDNADAVFDRVAAETVRSNRNSKLDDEGIPLSDDDSDDEGGAGSAHQTLRNEFGEEYSVPLLQKGLKLAPETMTKLEIMYNVRFLRTRKARINMFATMNYFRSVQRRLTFDSLGIVYEDKKPGGASDYGATNPSNFYVSRCNRMPADMVHTVDELMEAKEVEPRDDIPSLKAKSPTDVPVWCVEDPYGVAGVVYDASLADFAALEKQLLEMGSRHIKRAEEANAEHVADRAQVLSDLYEWEAKFQFQKSLVIAAYMNIYSHLLHRSEQCIVRDEIVRLMSWHPTFGNDTSYFRANFAREIEILKEKEALFTKMFADQVDLEKDNSEVGGVERAIHSLPGGVSVHQSMGNIARLIPDLKHSFLHFTSPVPQQLRDAYACDTALRILYWQTVRKLWDDNKAQYNRFSMMSSSLFDANVAAISSSLISPSWASVELACKQNVEGDDTTILVDSKAMSPPVQVLYNAIEGVLLREEITTSYLESETFRACYEAQRKLYGKETEYEDSRARENGYRQAKEANVAGAKGETKPVGSLACAEFDYTLKHLNFGTNSGLKTAFGLDEAGLQRLRIAAKCQELERALFMVAVRQNQVALDKLQKMQSRNNSHTFITESDKHNFRVKIRQVNDYMRSHFLTLNRRKNRVREMVWASLSLRSKPLLRSKAFTTEEITQQVEDIKFGLVSDYCESMMKEVGPETLRYQTIAVAESLSEVSAHMKAHCAENFADSIFYDSKTPWTIGKDHEKQSVVSMFSRNGKIENIWYIPNRQELLEFWSQDDAMTNSARHRRMAAMENIFQILRGLRDLYILIQCRCLLVAPSTHAGVDATDVLVDAMKYEWMKMKFSLEGKGDMSNDMCVNSVLQFRTFYYLKFVSSMNELYDQTIGCNAPALIPRLESWVPEHLAALQYFTKSAINLLKVPQRRLPAATSHLDFADARLSFPPIIEQVTVELGSMTKEHGDGPWHCSGGGARWFWEHRFKVTTVSNSIAVANLDPEGPQRGPGYCLGPYVGAYEPLVPESLQAILQHASSCAGAVRNFANSALMDIEYKVESLSKKINEVVPLKEKLSYLLNLEKTRTLKRQIFRLNDEVPASDDYRVVEAAIVTHLMRSQIVLLREKYNDVIAITVGGDESDGTEVAAGVQNKFYALQIVAEQLKNQLQKFENQLLVQEIECDRKVEETNNSINSIVAERCYALIFSVDSCNRTIRQLRRDLTNQKEKITEKVQSQFIDEISLLKMENIKLQNAFKEYQETMKNDMLGELSIAKQRTLTKIIESDITTAKLKHRTVRIAKAEDEVIALKRELTSKNKEIFRLKALAETEIIDKTLRFEKQLEKYREKAEGSETLWSRLNDIESREEALKKELVSAQTTSNELYQQLKVALSDFRSANQAKHELQRWKISNMHAMKDLQSQISDLKEVKGGRTNSPKPSPSHPANVEVPNSHPLRKELHTANQAVISLKRELDREKKAKRNAFKQVARMKEIGQSRPEHGKHGSVLADDYNDLREDFGALAAQNEKLRTILRNYEIAVPATFAMGGPKQLSERDWKYNSSRRPASDVSLFRSMERPKTAPMKRGASGLGATTPGNRRPSSAPRKRRSKTPSRKLGSQFPTKGLVIENRKGPNRVEIVSPLSKRKTRTLKKMLKLSGTSYKTNTRMKRKKAQRQGH
eukprot:g3973.t1